MIHKLNKHGKLLIRKINQNREINRMKNCPDESVQCVLRAFQTLFNETFEPEDCKAFERCETYRDALKKREDKISFEIFGSNKSQTVSEICQKAASPEIWCRFLYLLAKNLKSKNLLEVGTNLGISGSYLLEATADNSESRLTTLEGIPQLCAISAQRFSEISQNDKFEIIEGLYQETFPKILNRPVPFDFIFIDGNHRKDATLEYFTKLKSSENTVFIFDDINWSKGMNKAWKTIQKDVNVSYTIDFWKQGVAVISNTSIKAKKTDFKLFLSY